MKKILIISAFFVAAFAFATTTWAEKQSDCTSSQRWDDQMQRCVAIGDLATGTSGATGTGSSTGTATTGY